MTRMMSNILGFCIGVVMMVGGGYCALIGYIALFSGEMLYASEGNYRAALFCGGVLAIAGVCICVRMAIKTFRGVQSTRTRRRLV